jgi:hypothetical protein
MTPGGGLSERHSAAESERSPTMAMPEARFALDNRPRLLIYARTRVNPVDAGERHRYRSLLARRGRLTQPSLLLGRRSRY